MNNLMPIFLLHGLGANPVTLLPLELWLNYKGYKNTYRISYPVDKLSLIDSIAYVNKIMEELANKSSEIIVIGQSIGGRVANELHKFNWNIKLAIFIGSPLGGANLLNQLESWLPTQIRDKFYKLPYDDLKNLKNKANPPPHPYHAITMGWFNTNFDGCIYTNEGKFDDTHHTRLSWADHRTIFANPRLWICVTNLIKKMT